MRKSLKQWARARLLASRLTGGCSQTQQPVQQLPAVAGGPEGEPWPIAAAQQQAGPAPLDFEPSAEDWLAADLLQSSMDCP
jgi:hypothetical protein